MLRSLGFAPTEDDVERYVGFAGGESLDFDDFLNACRHCKNNLITGPPHPTPPLTPVRLSPARPSLNFPPCHARVSRGEGEKSVRPLLEG